MSTIKSKFAQYGTDIEAVFEGSDRDAMYKICLALEHYARDVGLADHRVKVGIEGLETLILQRAAYLAMPDWSNVEHKVHELAKRYGREVVR